MAHSHPSLESENTLDPPGSIVVIGATAAGIEAALYGRFLGYDVTVVEAVEIGHAYRKCWDQIAPFRPGRWLSPLALQALDAQQGSTKGHSESVQSEKQSESQTHAQLTYGQWVENYLIPLTTTDLLRDRILLPWRVVQVTTVPVSEDRDEENDNERPDSEIESLESIPPDFQIELKSADGQTQHRHCEAIITAVSGLQALGISFDLPAPYFYELGSEWVDPRDASDVSAREQAYRHMLEKIVAIYGQLSGRPDLDLYRPRRL